MITRGPYGSNINIQSDSSNPGLSMEDLALLAKVSRLIEQGMYSQKKEKDASEKKLSTDEKLDLILVELRKITKKIEEMSTVTICSVYPTYP